MAMEMPDFITKQQALELPSQEWRTAAKKMLRLVPTENARYESHTDPCCRPSLRFLVLMLQASTTLSEGATIQITLDTFRELNTAMPLPTPQYLLLPVTLIQATAEAAMPVGYSLSSMAVRV